MNIIRKPTPHHSARPDSAVISCIVLHCDAGRSEEGTISWLANPDSKVSYHYLVGRGGAVYQFVDEDRKAWHAGVSSFGGMKFCNNYSIGCSFANRNDGEPYTDEALAAMTELCRDLMTRYPVISRDRVTAHYVVSPTRKSDPAPPFDLTAFVAAL